jgi:hypothetical protein
MPLIHSIFGNPELGRWPTGQIIGLAMNYVGSNEQAYGYFFQIHTFRSGRHTYSRYVGPGSYGNERERRSSPDFPGRSSKQTHYPQFLEQEYGQTRGKASAFSTAREQLEYSLNPVPMRMRPTVGPG